MNPVGWVCPCGARYGLQSDYCQSCGRHYADGLWLYPGGQMARISSTSPVSPPPTPAKAPTSPAKAATSSGWFSVIAVLILLFTWGPLQSLRGRPSSEDTKNKLAVTIFQRKLATAMTQAGNADTFSFIRGSGIGVQVAVSEDWYRVGRRDKELLTENLRGVWWKAREEAGLDGAESTSGRVAIFDSSSNLVADSGTFGTKVYR